LWNNIHIGNVDTDFVDIFRKTLQTGTVDYLHPA
jgi:hypothetical protein